MIGTFHHIFQGDKARRGLLRGGYLSLDCLEQGSYNVKKITNWIWSLFEQKQACLLIET